MDAFWKYVNKQMTVWSLSVLVLVAILNVVGPVMAVDNTASLDVRRGAGFGRLVFDFDQMPTYSSQKISTIFVLNFKKPVSVNLQPVAQKLPDIISIARQDPDGTGLRFAMLEGFKVNVMKAGHFLIVDFLAKSWSGPPPPMPVDVIEKIAKEAELVRQAAAEQARQKALQVNPLRVELHVARHATFNRIQFNWNRFVTAQLTRKNDEISLLFGGHAVPDLARLKINPPHNLVSARHIVGKNSLQIVLQVTKGTKVRGFREGKNYVVDLTSDRPDAMSGVEKKLYAAAGITPTGQIGQAEEEITLSGNEAERPLQKNMKLKKPATGNVDGSRQKAGPPLPQRSSHKRKLNQVQARLNNRPAVTIVVKPLVQALETQLEKATSAQKKRLQPVAKNGIERVATAPKSPIILHNKLFEKPVAQKPVAQKLVAKMPVKQRPVRQNPFQANKIKITRSGSSVELEFPYKKKAVSAAIYQRNDILWVIVDHPKALDISGLKAQLGGIIDHVHHEVLNKSQLYEFHLSGPWLSSVSKLGPHWKISIGDLVTGTSKAVRLIKQINAAGQNEVLLSPGARGRLHRIKNRHSGNDLVVVTSVAPSRRVKKNYEHIEFELFQTLHGVVVRPLADDLKLSRNPLGVKIVAQSGLLLSGKLLKNRQAPVTPRNKRRNLARNLSFRDSPKQDLSGFMRTALQLETKIVENGGRKRRRLRLKLARHWLSRGFAPEGKAMLDIAETEDAEIIKDPVFRLLRGISNVMLRRYKEAGKDLNTHDLEDNPHASLWRGLAAYKAEKFSRALVELQKGEAVVKKYRPRQQAAFRLAGADTAIERKNSVLAGFELDHLPEQGATPVQNAMARYLEGRLMELQGRSKEAMQIYADVTRAGIRPVTARAVFRLTDLRLRNGDLKPEPGINILERLSIVWRGDEVELQVLHRLADLYLEQGRYQDAFKLMETAVRTYPKAEQALALQYRMKAQFGDLFLHGKADNLPAIKALALFYDNKYLVPPGRLGDEMIRRLADRLINVDLLDKAADLLEHQVARRLKGAGRAQVAIRLALIHLMQHRPKRALKVLYRTRQSGLPGQVRKSRKILEARAYAELGRAGTVLELLATDESQQALEIKALALWNGEKWTQAGEQYEKLLGTKWREEGALTVKQRLRVLRAAISYTLGNDRLGLQRIGEKYRLKMSGGSDAKAFALITDPLKTNSQVVGRLARDIADIDTLEAFIKVFRQRLGGSAGPRETSAIQ